MNIKRKIAILLISALVTSSVLSFVPVKAATFDPTFILSNSDIDEYNSMTLKEIQNFLEIQGSALAEMTTDNVFGVRKSVAEIIYDAAHANLINPKWILVTLQKEQSLINDSSPTQRRLDWAMGYGICDDCSKEDPRLQKFKGLGQQIEHATARMRYYINNPTQFNFQAGMTKLISGVDVTIKNQATALLYIYTPHLHGNYNFWKLWMRWFSRQHPDGTLLQAEGEPGVWLVKDGARRAFLSKTILLSRFDTKDIIQVSKTDIEKYPIGAPIKFPNYSLVSDDSGDIYLLVDDQKKKFESEEVFRRLGFRFEEVDKATDSELASYINGRNITLESAYPRGQLIQDSTTGGVYFVQDGFKYPIVSREIMKVNYPTHSIINGDPDTLAGFMTGNKVLFKDGKLVKAKDDPRVYVISNSKRTPIANEETFVRLGYRWTDIIETSASAINIHPLGEELNVLLESFEDDAFKTTNLP